MLRGRFVHQRSGVEDLAQVLESEATRRLDALLPLLKGLNGDFPHLGGLRLTEAEPAPGILDLNRQFHCGGYVPYELNSFL